MRCNKSLVWTLSGKALSFLVKVIFSICVVPSPFITFLPVLSEDMIIGATEAILQPLDDKFEGKKSVS